MSMTFDATADLATVADRLEPIQFRRRGKANTTLVPHALRRRLQLHEARPSDGKVTRSDAVWHLPAGELPGPPRLGDAIVDAAGQVWTILDIERTESLGAWRVLTRELAVAAGLDQIVTIQQALPGKSSTGDLQPVWIDAWCGVRARFQPLGGALEPQHDQQSILQRYDVTLAENIPITHDHRLIDAEGATFKLLAFDMPQRIDELLVVRAVRWPSK
jgi:hypothetical protein